MPQMTAWTARRSRLRFASSSGGSPFGAVAAASPCAGGRGAGGFGGGGAAGPGGFEQPALQTTIRSNADAAQRSLLISPSGGPTPPSESLLRQRVRQQEHQRVALSRDVIARLEVVAERGEERHSEDRHGEVEL